MTGVDYVNTSESVEHNQQKRTCFTATVTKLLRGQALQLQDFSIDDQTAYLSTNYFGVVQLQPITDDLS